LNPCRVLHGFLRCEWVNITFRDECHHWGDKRIAEFARDLLGDCSRDIVMLSCWEIWPVLFDTACRYDDGGFACLEMIPNFDSGHFFDKYGVAHRDRAFLLSRWAGLRTGDSEKSNHQEICIIFHDIAHGRMVLTDTVQSLVNLRISTKDEHGLTRMKSIKDDGKGESIVANIESHGFLF